MVSATRIKPVVNIMFDFLNAQNAFWNFHAGNQIGKIVMQLR